MCSDCGCGTKAATTTIPVVENLLSENDRIAAHIREHLDALVDAGFVTVSTKPTGKRGRPALRYASTAPDPQQMVDAYLLLLDDLLAQAGIGATSIAGYALNEPSRDQGRSNDCEHHLVARERRMRNRCSIWSRFIHSNSA